ncbi:MAG: DUF2628 domain-containing protein [Pseudomonadota bacterium]
MMYTVHAPAEIGPLRLDASEQAEDHRFDNVIAVPDGMAKWALILPPFWLAWHRLWGALTIYAAITLVLLSLLGTGFFTITLFLGGLPGLYLLLEGNNLRRDALGRSGWKTIDVLEAANETEAITRFLARWTETGPQTSVPTQPYSPSMTRPQTVAATGPNDRLAFGLFPDGTD